MDASRPHGVVGSALTSSALARIFVSCCAANAARTPNWNGPRVNVRSDGPLQVKIDLQSSNFAGLTEIKLLGAHGGCLGAKSR